MRILIGFKRIVFAAVAAVGVIGHALGAVYVKPTACGAGDGSDWDNAIGLSAAISTVLDTGDPLYLAQGVYEFGSEYDQTSKTLIMYGGYKGESGTDDTRDVDLYQTILTQKKTATVTWEHFTVGIGDDDMPQVTAEDTGLPVIVDDKVSLPPAYNGLKDGYRIKTTAGNVGRFFMWRGGTLTLDGLWFVGYNAGRLIYPLGGSYTVNNCRFVGFLITDTGISSSGVNEWSNCQFRFLYATTGSASALSVSGTTIRNCTFECCSRSSNKVGGNVLNAQGTGTAVEDSAFTHCIEVSTLEGRRGGLDKEVNTGNIYGFTETENGVTTFSRCTIADCYTVSANRYGGTPLVLGCRTVSLTDCEITGNLSEVRVWDGYGYAMVGRNYGGVRGLTYEANLTVRNTVFRENTIRSYACTASSGSYVLGIIGAGFNPSTTSFTLAGDVFDSNVAEAGVAVAGVTPILSRGLASVATDSGTVSHALENLTFVGPKADGVYDLVQYGGNQSKYAMSIKNSLFLVTDANRYEPFRFDAPQKVTLENTTVQGLTAEYRDASVTYAGIETDYVPLDTDYAPTVRTPGLSTVTTKEGVTNRGAVQGVKQPEDTYSLTVRCDPLSLGAVSPVSAVAVGTDPVTLTAVPVAGASVLGWFDENDVEIPSTDGKITVTAQSLGDADAVYTVRFDMAKTKLTFNLGEHATFKDTGSNVRCVEAMPKSAFPVPDAANIQLEEGYVLLGWEPAFPSLVPDAAATYVLQTLDERQVRVVRYDSNNKNTGVKDGQTWATAFTSLQEAMTAARLTYSEIWVKKGTHVVSMSSTESFVPRDHMVIRGGYIGDDADDAARGDEPSVLEGKYAGSSKVTTMFDLSAVTCDETMVFDSVTLANASASLINCGANAHPLITNCTFTGAARIAASGSIRILDSTFKDAQYPQNNTEIVNVTLGANATCAVERCTFDTCTVYTRSPITISGSGWLVVTDTTFTNCTSLCYYSPASIGEPNSCTIAAPNLKMSGCRIVGNLSDGGGSVMRVSNGGSVTDTLIAGNTLRRYATGSTNKGLPTTGATHFSLVPFLGALRMERCTVVSNTVDCTVPEKMAGDVNNMSLFYVNAAKALLVNNTVFGNTVTTVNPSAGAGDATASIFFLTGKGMGAAVNNTFCGNVAADGELLVSAARTVTDDFGDFNNIWAAKESILSVRRSAWTGCKLVIPVKGDKSVSCGKNVYAGVGADSSLYVDLGDGYVKLPDCTTVADPELGNPICDILGQARPLNGSALGSAQSRITPGLVIILQ